MNPVLSGCPSAHPSSPGGVDSVAAGADPPPPAGPDHGGRDDGDGGRRGLLVRIADSARAAHTAHVPF